MTGTSKDTTHQTKMMLTEYLAGDIRITPPPLTKILEYLKRTHLKGMLAGLPITPDIHHGPFSGTITPTTMAVVIREQTMLIDFYLAPPKIQDHLILTTLRECQTGMGIMAEHFILEVMEEGQCHTLEETQAAAEAMMLWQANPLAGILMSKIAGECPVKVSKVPNRGKGLVASRDIDVGEVIALYPVDWMVKETDFKPAQDDNGLPRTINAIVGQQAQWGNLQCLAFGIGNENEPANCARMVAALIKNDGINTPMMREYGMNLDADGGSMKDRTCVWADPTFKHECDWMLAHMSNDGMFTPGMTGDQYMKIQKSFRKPFKTKAEIKKMTTTMTLGLVCRARKKIRKGEEVVTHYGKEYWFNGEHARLVSLEGEELKKALADEVVADQKRNDFVKEWKIDMVNIHMMNLENLGFEGTETTGGAIWSAEKIRKKLIGNHHSVGFCLRDNEEFNRDGHKQVPVIYYGAGSGASMAGQCFKL